MSDRNMFPGVRELRLSASLDEGIRIWKVEAGEVDIAGRYARCLSPDEQQRAQRFHDEDHRLRYIAARAALRHLLGGQLACPPGDIRLTCGSAGRPEIAWPPTTLSFNVSHSGSATLIALSRSGMIGVDLECLHRDIDPVPVGRQVFCADELLQLECCEESERTRFFFRLWTAKESVLKLLGAGFSLEPRDFSVAHALADGSPVHMPASMMPSKTNSLICLVGFDIEDRFAAALATVCLTEG